MNSFTTTLRISVSFGHWMVLPYRPRNATQVIGPAASGATVRATTWATVALPLGELTAAALS
jgi:hypothetical protein